MALMASSTSVPMVGCGALALRCCQRASFGTQKMLAARYSSWSSGLAPLLRSVSSSACFASNASEMYLRKIRPRTTCLYSAASMLLRSASAAAQSLASSPRVAVVSVFFPFRTARSLGRNYGLRHRRVHTAASIIVDSSVGVRLIFLAWEPSSPRRAPHEGVSGGDRSGLVPVPARPPRPRRGQLLAARRQPALHGPVARPALPLQAARPGQLRGRRGVLRPLLAAARQPRLGGLRGEEWRGVAPGNAPARGEVPPVRRRSARRLHDRLHHPARSVLLEPTGLAPHAHRLQPRH